MEPGGAKRTLGGLAGEARQAVVHGALGGRWHELARALGVGLVAGGADLAFVGDDGVGGGIDHAAKRGWWDGVDASQQVSLESRLGIDMHTQPHSPLPPYPTCHSPLRAVRSGAVQGDRDADARIVGLEVGDARDADGNVNGAANSGVRVAAVVRAGEGGVRLVRLALHSGGEDAEGQGGDGSHGQTEEL